ncbi:glycosyltransferase [Escherichia coli]|uniref:glycosyltransferase n=1 Tax=Escherichia coli TaxID=562 RepID=UPI001C5F4E7E|nr:glycosyltransferase [Escherichia coli]MCZ0471875.1 glycosyltransferase [Escherichia coli]HAW0604160.1 glycosyltransferase [Escherichia coli]HCN5244502.1 glycosyltransferase [Escherichia coli]
MINFKMLVVLYKESIDSSTTLESIKKVFEHNHLHSNFELLIWDNSPVSLITKEELRIYSDNCGGIKHIEYIHNELNKPLSFIYNFALNKYKDGDYIIILDQDSDFDKGYIEEVINVALEQSPELILPIIYYKNKIVSPSKISYIRGNYYKCIPCGRINPKKISAINSGMIISLDYIKRIAFEYNKYLKNYCTDDYFMRQFRRFGNYAYVLNYTFKHHLSLSTLNDNSELLKERYKLMKEGRYIVYSENLFDKIAIRVYFSIHKIYMAFKYKDISYLKV